MNFTTVAFELAVLFVVAAITPTINFLLPLRPTLLILVLSQQLPWLIVGIVASLGGTIGALPLYSIALKVSDTTTVHRWLQHGLVARLLRPLRTKMFLLLVLIIISPLPDQLIGLSGGAERYPVKKFLFANMIGRLLMYMPLAFVAAYFHSDISAAWSWLIRSLSF